jgi:3-hydroxyisobutyrate dehydrogenase
MPQPARPINVVGFIGLGVMGEPMCGHLARRSGREILGHDVRPEPLARLAGDGVKNTSLEAIADRADLILLSLPTPEAVGSVMSALQPRLKSGQCLVDTSTTPVSLTRRLGERLGAAGIGFADAPVARTREAASRGELSIMVGASETMFAHLQPLLATMGTDVTHCGPVGCGQVVKILNNMLLFQNVAALAEAIALARRNGVPAETLLNTVARGSGDSFALRNHGMKSMVPRVYPERAFPITYAIKDLTAALEMAEAAGIEVEGARLTMRRLRVAKDAGYGAQYFPAMLEVIDRE